MSLQAFGDHAVLGDQDNDTTGTMGAYSALLALPVEVRLNIWNHLFMDEWMYIDPCTYGPLLGQQQRQRQQYHIPPIVRACRLLKDETEPLYYRNVRIHFDIYTSSRPLGLDRFLNDIGETNCRLLRQFQIRWGNYVDIRIDLSRKNVSEGKAIVDTAWTCRLQPNTAISSRGGMHSPLLNPTTSVRYGTRNITTVSGIPGPESLEFWQTMGTKEFCAALADIMSKKLDERMAKGSSHLTKEGLLDFIATTDEHAEGLRWLWFW